MGLGFDVGVEGVFRRENILGRGNNARLVWLMLCFLDFVRISFLFYIVISLWISENATWGHGYTSRQYLSKYFPTIESFSIIDGVECPKGQKTDALGTEGSNFILTPGNSPSEKRSREVAVRGLGTLYNVISINNRDVFTVHFTIRPTHAPILGDPRWTCVDATDINPS